MRLFVGDNSRATLPANSPKRRAYGDDQQDAVRTYLRSLAKSHMPLLVENQLEAFRSDSLLSKMAEGVEIQYAGIPHSPSADERRQKLLQDCDNMCLPITVLCNGINLTLSLKKIDLQDTEVSFESDLIFNGVCTRCKGRLNRNTLKGHGRLEFDTQRAEQEKRRVEQRAKSFGQRIAALRNLILQYGRPHPTS